jgi:hypothetical protein
MQDYLASDSESYYLAVRIALSPHIAISFSLKVKRRNIKDQEQQIIPNYNAFISHMP